ncbi:gallidermin family lantibiotic [Pseudonocardia sp. TRM90224]|uniref:gallidermin family lantibiotic n=1 Tax=Pseudonocardia sp. TRM90224 TaxID=2812678 RepID=UPI001E597E9F|nr:gallidermin family lantibiotic [Pseudonocardia sp. TRM90224]
MSPVAAPVEDLFELDVELLDEASDLDAETKLRCFSTPSCCRPHSFRSIDMS